MRLFDLDNPISRFLSGVWDLVLLQLLFVLFSIPIITIGASLTALFSVIRKMHQKTISGVIRTFWKEFCSNFKQSTIIWVLLIAAGTILLIGTNMLSNVQTNGGQLVVLIANILAVILCFIFLYVFPLMAWFNNTTGMHILNAIRLACTNLILTIAVAVIYSMVVVMLYCLTPVFLFLGFSSAAFCSGFLFGKSFQKYIIAGGMTCTL